MNSALDRRKNEMEKQNSYEQSYDDIIHLARPSSTDYLPMSMRDRAAQFSPFAALTGYDSAVKETARLTDKRIELDEMEITILDNKLRIIQEKENKQKEIEITFFQEDERKKGGTYRCIRGIVKKIDLYEKAVIMQDGTRILIQDIIDISGDLLQNF